MKRIWLLGIPFLLTSFISCDSQDAITESSSDEVEKVLVTIGQMVEEDNSSRLSANENASEYLWQLNDTIGIFPSKGGQVEFAIEGDAAGHTFAYFDGGAWALRKGYTYSAYYPFNFKCRNIEAVPISYIGQVFDANYETDEREHLRNYLYFASTPSSTEENLLLFNMNNIGNVLKLTLTMPTPATYTSVTVYTDAEVIPVKKTLNLKDGLLTQTVVELSDRLTIGLENVKTTTANEEVVVYMSFPSVSEGTHPIKLVAYDSEGFAYPSDITKSTGELAYAQFSVNGFQRRFATPTLKEGFNINLGDWGNDGTDHGGNAN